MMTKGLLKFAQKVLPTSLKKRIKSEIFRRFTVPSMEWSLANMRRLGFNPSTIIDIGAYRGDWTQMAHSIFPSASILMLEAQENNRPVLEAVAKQYPDRMRCRIALLGPENRDQAVFNYFDFSPTASSMLSPWNSRTGKEIICRMETLDSVLATANFTCPDLLKLDVQGYELEVLKGGAKCLASAEVVLMEVSVIESYEAIPLLPEVVSFMKDRGFRVYDICSLIRRPLDDALFQADLIFVKEGSPLFRDKVWGKSDLPRNT